MKIGFLYDYGAKKEIGMGHYYRCQWIGEELKKLGHKVFNLDDGVITTDLDAVVMDYIGDKSAWIESCKKESIKVVVIDGTPESAALADISISCNFNLKAQYRGLQYAIIPKLCGVSHYQPQGKKSTIFVSMGGYDHNNFAEMVLRVLKDKGLYAIITKSINHPNFKEMFDNVEVSRERDFYIPMSECLFGIVNGGSTLFQALHYGLPCIAVPQYKYQSDAIDLVQNLCLSCLPNKDDISKNIDIIKSSEYKRESMSVLSRYHIDGSGLSRVVKLIDALGID